MPDKYTSTRYNYAPTIKKKRTRFDLSHNVLTTFNTGDLVPVLCEPVYPGETFSLKTASLVRLETSLHQTMDNAYLEFAFFFVPNRIIFDDFEKFLGANDDPWAQSNTYILPQIYLTTAAAGIGGNVAPQSLLNQLGVPAGSYGRGGNFDALLINELPLRAVFQCFNDWYRNENLDSIVYFTKGSTSHYLASSFTYNGASFDPSASILKVNRFHDLFSTALPAPQKGPDTTLGLDGYLPVGYIKDTFYSTNDITSLHAVSSVPNGSFQDVRGYDANGLGVGAGSLVADSSAINITINQLRLAICSQAISELKARGGTRYKEILYSTWSVDAPDAVLDRAEFLGGKRIPISMLEVLQTSETGTTVLGTDAGHSKTLDASDSFVKSFVQHGWIIGFAYTRTARSYSQGIDRKLRDLNYYDLYQPLLDNIGEVAIKKSELYALDTGTGAGYDAANSVFGYQEAWYHLKERTNQIRGYFQAGISGTLDSWHYGDKYLSSPYLSSSWLKEGVENVDRTIAVQSSAAYQWTLSCHFELYATRMMNKYSIPNTFGFGF